MLWSTRMAGLVHAHVQECRVAVTRAIGHGLVLRVATVLINKAFDKCQPTGINTMSASVFGTRFASVLRIVLPGSELAATIRS